jgi:branched-chain amino acid transport system ATP-binding protein
VAILELTDVEKRFGGLPAVAGVTFTVDEGEIVALVGPNGAGKTTLLKAIGGMQPPTNGRIVFDGVEITGFRPHRVRHAGVAMVLQTPRAFETMTVRENAVLGALFGGPRVRQDEAARRAEEMLEFVGLADRRDEPVGSLNLHEQRLLEVARQLAGRPRLVLLDEVMAGLNDTELHSSVNMVRRARAELGVTVIWVEHVMKAVMSLAERILVLNFGQLIADGPPADVMRLPDVVTAYLGERHGGRGVA